MEANPASSHRDALLLETRLAQLSLEPAVSGPIPTPDTSETPDTSTASATQPQLIENNFTCDICQSSYKIYGRLVNHQKEKHGIEADSLLKCEKCSKYFETVKKLNRHKKSHNK